MKNLTLVTTETFGTVPCDFYRSENEILLTRKQIGEALEYSDPQKAIDNIHAKHSDRLDDLCMTLKLRGTDNKTYNTTLYSQRGIMEICRWSRQKKANEFMDWVWDIIESYRNGTLTTPQHDDSLILQEIQSLRQEINKLRETSSKPLPAPKYSQWKATTFKKLRLITETVNQYSDEILSLSDVMSTVFKEYQDTYDVDLSDYTYQYKHEYGLSESTKVYELDVINHYKELKHSYTLTLDSIMERLHISTDKYITKNIFDIVAEKLNTAS